MLADILRVDHAFAYANAVDEAAVYRGVLAFACADLTEVGGASQAVVAVFAGARHALAFGAAVALGAGVVVVAYNIAQRLWSAGTGFGVADVCGAGIFVVAGALVDHVVAVVVYAITTFRGGRAAVDLARLGVLTQAVARAADKIPAVAAVYRAALPVLGVLALTVSARGGTVFGAGFWTTICGLANAIAADLGEAIHLAVLWVLALIAHAIAASRSAILRATRGALATAEAKAYPITAAGASVGTFAAIFRAARGALTTRRAGIVSAAAAIAGAGVYILAAHGCTYAVAAGAVGDAFVDDPVAVVIFEVAGLF